MLKRTISIIVCIILILCTNLCIVTQANDGIDKNNDKEYLNGLDDKSDYTALFWGTVSLVIFLPPQLKTIVNGNTTLQKIGALLGSISMSYAILFNFLEAFDIYDYNGDGK
jgi:hypothetical protein